MQHLKNIYFMFQTKKKRKRLNFHHHTPLQQVHKNVTKQLCEILHDLQKFLFCHTLHTGHNLPEW